MSDAPSDRVESRCEVAADGTRVLEHATLDELVEYDSRAGRGQRISAERRGVSAWNQRPCKDFRGAHGADGDAVAQGLGEGHDIRYDAAFLIGEERPGAAHARLDLVEEQQAAALIRQISQSAQEARRRRADSSLALHRLDDDRGGA